MANPTATKILYLATRNLHKAEELDALLRHFAWQVKAAAEVAPSVTWEETGSTFRENARIKANALRKQLSGWILADDSGLEVAALDGAPGVYSSSYGGDEGNDQANNARLIRELTNRGLQSSPAQFRCTLLLLSPTDEEHYFEGLLPGRVQIASGGCHGFGYDPHFVPEGLEQTLAELPPERKNALSHRSKAVEQLQLFLSNQI